MSALSSPLPSIQKLVLKDIAAVLEETYNEGDGSADVTSVECALKKSKAVKLTAVCTIGVQVKPDSEEEFESATTCSGLKYLVAPDLSSLDHVNGWDECLETLEAVTSS